VTASRPATDAFDTNALPIGRQFEPGGVTV
jgi:hypothetical protein